tara:strand:- start:5028 stop:5486 length:459 start_codon:yes stop_codon:yes gene_type:complete
MSTPKPVHHFSDDVKMLTEEELKEQTGHVHFLNHIAIADVKYIKEQEKTYQGSWKKRGGAGAFMNLGRKWDRLEQFMAQGYDGVDKYDVFAAIQSDSDDFPLDLVDTPSSHDGTVLDQVRDLRQYLMLVESEVMRTQALGKLQNPSGPNIAK